jgi:DNA-binding MarR family transcriptional regulator
MGKAGTEPFRGIAFNLSSLGYAVSKRFKGILEPFDLHPREFAVLRAVGVLDGRTQQALADELQIPRSRMVSIVDELERRGLIERRPNPADRRVRELHLTGEGRMVLKRAFAEAIAYEQQVTSPLAPDEREQLLDFLERITAGLGIGAGAHTALRDDGEPGGTG